MQAFHTGRTQPSPVPDVHERGATKLRGRESTQINLAEGDRVVWSVAAVLLTHQIGVLCDVCQCRVDTVAATFLRKHSRNLVNWKIESRHDIPEQLPLVVLHQLPLA